MDLAMLFKSSILTGWIITTPTASPVALADLANWGLAGAIVAYVFWRDWQREKSMRDITTASDRFIREALLSALDKNTTALEELKGRPCLLTQPTHERKPL